MMYTRLKRGPTDKVKEYVGPEGSIVLDTDLKNLRLQDGTTRGGVVTLDNGISISGVELPLFRDTEYHLTIANYDSFSDYGVVVDRGTASLEGSVITLVTPWDSEIIHLDIFKNGVGKRLTVPVEVPEPWSTFNVLTPAPVEMQNVTAAADEELIYVVVRSPTENQGTFWSYNILTDTWTELPPCPEFRNTPVCTFGDGKFFIANNTNNLNLHSVLIYDVVMGEWSKSPMFTGNFSTLGGTSNRYWASTAYNMGFTYKDGYLYTAGSAWSTTQTMSARHGSNRLVRYDLETGEFTVVNSSVHSGGRRTTVTYLTTHDNEFFALASSDTLDTSEHTTQLNHLYKFDGDSFAKTSLGRLVGQSGPSKAWCKMNGKIYDIQLASSIREYDMSSDVLTTIVKPVGTPGAMVGYNNKLYLIGGTDSTGDPTNGIIEFY